MEDSSAAISAQRLGRRYGSQRALASIDLVVERGAWLGVVGPDGSGKTTLLQMLAAILDPTEGECRVLGLDTRRQAKAIAARIGYMSQGFTLYDRLSVDENLDFAARIRGVAREAYRERRERLLAMANLEPFTERPAGKLSGGMRKKLALCTNLIHEPELLILDEPGLGVDPLSRRELWEILESLRGPALTTVVATSYMDEAERCDRVLLLQRGTVLVHDTPERARDSARGRVYEILTREPARTARALSASSELRGIQVLPDRVRFQAASTAGGAGSAGIALEDRAAARPVPPSLEDVFVLHSENDAASSPGPATAGSEPRIEGGGLRTDELVVEFGRFRAVDRVTLEAAPGELLALLGPNGAGKTTLIRALCGLVPLAGGTARVAGHDVRAESAALRGRIGYMSQRFSLYADLTVRENLTFFAAAYGLSARTAAPAITLARRRTGLEQTPDQPAGSLSGATRQRLALACAILHRPAVLFLDEPTSGVDPLARYRFWSLIRSLAGEGMTVLVTTHVLDEAAYCDRIGLMMDGRLIAHGPLDALRRETGAGPEASVEETFVRAIERARRARDAA